ncbi:MAG TPA: phage tail sheath subtilisin-like domain-containing protein [Candidatus Binatia bacterium]|nr:phage tail sheath subtilisin-like domain-containing protein [Candidatus Binatia bacterium]
MPISPTYPGVYVEEVPSGVRTITGVGTSIALFLGRTMQGEVSQPTLCLSEAAFERAFSTDATLSDLPRSVNLFFGNGGTSCWVMRILGAGHAPASVTLENEANNIVLKATATSDGVVGNDIRIAITYNSADPEGSFNLEVFSWTTDSRGQLVKTGRELYTNLTMDQTNNSTYAPTVVSQSSLITLQDVAVRNPRSGFSQSGFPLAANTFPDLQGAVVGIFGKALGLTTNHLLMSVDGGAFADFDLSSVDVAGSANQGALELAIQTALNNQLLGTTKVTVNFIAGPSDTQGGARAPFGKTAFLRITSNKSDNFNADVRIMPAAAGDVAVLLGLGAGQGGIEVPVSSKYRPAPTGVTMLCDPLAANPQFVTFGALLQNQVTNLLIGAKTIPLSLITVQTVPPGTAPIFEDQNAGSDGVREKLGIMRDAINAFANSDPTFAWQAAVIGTRLMLTPTAPGDNNIGTIASTPGAQNIGNLFETNVRYYSLGTGGAAKFQTAPVDGNNGGTLALSDYANAYPIIDQEVDLFNLMVLPADADSAAPNPLTINGPASVFCQQRRALLLIDAPKSWQQVTDALSGMGAARIGLVKDASALFFPWITIQNGVGTVNVGPSGAVAGVMARIDATRGVWKAPAGTEADIREITNVQQRYSDGDNGFLNPRAINTIRVFPDGIVIWGSRTVDGDDDFGSEYKYIPVRRLAYFLEESLYRGLKWVVFEPNDEPLWAQIRLNVGAFMHEQFRKGAFAGATPSLAYFVKCDQDTTTQDDQNLGIVNIVVGFAPLKPAEFVLIQLQQMAGQIGV